MTQQDSTGMRSFELFDHTADVGLRARGDTLAELLVACAEGMFSVLVEGGDVREEARAMVELEAEDAEELVHGWLRELLFRFSAKGSVFGRFEIHEASPTRLRGTGTTSTLPTPAPTPPLTERATTPAVASSSTPSSSTPVGPA